ncbi:acyltransferase [Rouxiella sp. S1S-2]|uniref:acyltransferase n=1 Tax=Rouxiella sp. S1S-2 TaxID=2653856 RepID=UPI001D01AC00|nr:acyltransferase [Rouxiella sp. S1S-2]
MFRKIRLRFLISFVRCLFLMIKYGKDIKINPLRVYISFSAKIKITDGGTIEIRGGRDRVFLSKNTSIHCSGGTLTIGNGVFFNENNHLVCHSSMSIGDDCLFGQNVCFFDSDHQFGNLEKKIRDQGYSIKPVSVADNVWIGAGSIVTKGTSIGAHSVIGANSVVRGLLDGQSVYAGNPVKFVRNIHGNR